VPRYCYKCTECASECEVRHGITERLHDCLECSSEGSLVRIPQLTNFVRKQEVRDKKAGSLVKEYIEENKQILKEERKERIKYND
jgi:hypothetical protein